MSLRKTTGLAMFAVALVALSATQAAAQAPTLSATANGAVVTIQWTGVPGALSYNLQAGLTPGGTEVASVNLPAALTQVVVAAPNSVYYLRVRALAGNIVGPFSNEVIVTVGSAAPPPGGCQTPPPPTIATVVTGGTVTVNWGAVPGTAGYRVELSRFPNATELVQNVAANVFSLNQYIGAAGTFYARVVAGNACGLSTSPTVPFTIDNPSGGGIGPRTPDPAPGQLLPLPGYGAEIARSMASAYRGDLQNSCREHGGNNVWLFRLLAELRKRDSRWGLNDKRGNRGDMSQDIITYNPTGRPDNGESQVYLVDTISGHCGNNPDWNWTDVTAATWAARGSSACGTEWCARWTIDAYLRAGFPADPR